MSIQALIPSALAALHNFIWRYDPNEIGEIQMYDDDEPLEIAMAPRPESVGELGVGPVTREEMVRANARRDQIAGAMWEQYRSYLESRAAPG